MNHAVRLISLLLLSSLILAACSKTNLTNTIQPPATVTPPNAAPPTVKASASPPPSTELTQTYEEPQGSFTISFPQGYQFEQSDKGVIFRSEDEAFRGEVVFGSAQGGKYTSDQLESFLKEAYRTNLKLTEVEWQKTETQPDGSLRIDWVGKDPQGNVLDAESFIEQRGDTIYILTLSGINKPYLDYLTDAQAIVNSYRVRE
ncbi:hypothetical protein [Thermocoleostomius sinensis]|jgi:hypothetical protein|uniref:DUF1795 domain-containing protein n=1 Tax=Thermocoleostomius sinensis A174 TaxID=2016057 RepID=A0A9E8ZKK5_9CYAN|nr:hypothetical protein [Thermocoleostomius sinensis]WAL60206.1 hypothetical protein OXH18_24070 [Thermocoleostomius sinensis A174]